MEILRSGRWQVDLLCLDAALAADVKEEALQCAERVHMKVEIVATARIEELCHAPDHQGLAARMGAFPYTTLEQLLDNANADNCLFALLDRVQDAYNFGAIVRAAEVLGFQGIIIGERSQTGVTSMAARTSAGAVNHIPITQVASLRAAAGTLHQRGVRLVAATEKGRVPIHTYDWTGAVTVVLGNESVGIRPELLDLCDDHVCIEQAGCTGSLNVASAASIVFYEAVRCRRNST